jgi:hypothetical protein
MGTRVASPIQTTATRVRAFARHRCGSATMRAKWNGMKLGCTSLNQSPLMPATAGIQGPRIRLRSWVPASARTNGIRRRFKLSSSRSSNSSTVGGADLLRIGRARSCMSFLYVSFLRRHPNQRPATKLAHAQFRNMCLPRSDDAKGPPSGGPSIVISGKLLTDKAQFQSAPQSSLQPAMNWKGTIRNVCADAPSQKGGLGTSPCIVVLTDPPSDRPQPQTRREHQGTARIRQWTQDVEGGASTVSLLQCPVAHVKLQP